MEKIFLGGRQTEEITSSSCCKKIIQTFRQVLIKLGQQDKENAIFNKSGGKICRGCWSSYERFSKLQEKIEEKLLHTLAEEQGQEQVASFLVITAFVVLLGFLDTSCSTLSGKC